MISRIFWVITIAFLIRIVSGYLFFGSYDINNAYYISNLISCGTNVYKHSSYNYFPPWLVFLYLSHFIHINYNLPFYFLIKIAPIIADIITTVYIYKILKIKSEKYALIGSLLYALNPVSIIITSLHGQFDSLPIMFSLMAFYYIIKNKYSFSSVLLGLAITFKTWPIFLVPIFGYQVFLKSRKNLLYIFITLLIPFITIFPILIKYPTEISSKVLFYKGTMDYGLSVILLYLKENINLLNNLITQYFLVSKIVLLFFLGLITLYSIIRKLSLNQSIILILLTFFITSPNIGSQYLIWIVPFLIIDNIKTAFIYTFITTITLLVNYLGFRSNALMTNLSLSLEINNDNIPWGETMVFWWLMLIILFIYYLRRKTDNNIDYKIINNRFTISTFKIILILIIPFVLSLIPLIPANNSCRNEPASYYFDSTFK